MSKPGGDLVFIGLSLSSSWGNGHATTYRALLRGLATIDQRVLFLERDVPWYAENRDLPDPDFCELGFYASVAELAQNFGTRIAGARAVIVGSYVPDGAAVLDLVLEQASGLIGFYDIDTPITLAALDVGTEDYIALRQIPRLDLYYSFTGGPTLDRLAQNFGAQRPRALYCAVDETRWRPMAADPRWDLGYLGTYSPDRQPALERLLLQPARRLPRMRFVVAGPQYPAGIDWPANVERVEHVAPVDHAVFYAAQRFTLNITRAAMITAGWSPSVRLFEAASCGTPIISDRWPGLSDILPEREAILVADEVDDVVSALTSIADTDRQAIARRARAIVLADHTGTARARQLLRDIAVGRRSVAGWLQHGPAASDRNQRRSDVARFVGGEQDVGSR
jgi:spore maturation protein CgeB